MVFRKLGDQSREFPWTTRTGRDERTEQDGGPVSLAGRSRRSSVHPACRRRVRPQRRGLAHLSSSSSVRAGMGVQDVPRGSREPVTTWRATTATAKVAGSSGPRPQPANSSGEQKCAVSAGLGSMSGHDDSPAHHVCDGDGAGGTGGGRELSEVTFFGLAGISAVAGTRIRGQAWVLTGVTRRGPAARDG